MAASIPFEIGAATHVGRVRKSNEDGLLVRSELGLWAVADGMGGHHAGELASAAVVEALSQIEPQESGEALLHCCEERLGEANRAIRDLAFRNGYGIIGSTVVALLIFERRFHCLWAGDSRIYLVRRGGVTQLTRDHSEVDQLVADGRLTQEQARVWPGRNVITRAVGAGDRLELDLQRGELAPGDSFVLCSDGLTSHVEADEIPPLLGGRRAQEACNELIELALKRGGSDNVTVIVVHYRPKADQTIIRPRTAAEAPPSTLWD